MIYLTGLVFGLALFEARADMAWVQMGPGGIAELRLVSKAADCPSIWLDNVPQGMEVRAQADAKFPLICSKILPRDISRAHIEKQPIPLPVAEPQRIIVLGDTGCRINGQHVQACRDPVRWPFARLAAAAAGLKPDLVLHVGDYHYRETPCPFGQEAACGGSPYGDQWDAWNADFFEPAAPLLRAAPWVFVRGNHEECKRAGWGWMRLMGPGNAALALSCGHVEPYRIRLKGADLVVLDVADASDYLVDRDLAKLLRAEVLAQQPEAGRDLMVSMHRPLLGSVELFGFKLGGNRTLLAGWRPAHLEHVDLLLSGHIHRFEVMNFSNAYPPQLIAGHGGDLLSKAPLDLSGLSVFGTKITSGQTLPGFGFVLLQRRAQGWAMDVYDVQGVLQLSCSYAERQVHCPAAVTDTK